MASLGEDAIKFAAEKSAKIATHARGDWKKIAAYGAAAAIVFVGAAIGYAGLKKIKERDEKKAEEKPDEKPEEKPTEKPTEEDSPEE